MSSRILFKPVATVVLDLVANPVTTAAWVQVSASLSAPSSAVEVYNGSDSLMQLATGASGSEVALPYTLLPGRSVVLPMEVSRTKRVAVKAIDKTANVENLVLNFFG